MDKFAYKPQVSLAQIKPVSSLTSTNPQRNIIRFDFSGVTGLTSQLEIQSAQCWGTSLDQAVDPSTQTQLYYNSNSQMYTIDNNGGSSDDGSVEIWGGLNNSNLGGLYGNLITLNPGAGRTFTTPPTFEFINPPIIPNDPLTNNPVMEILSTSQTNALRVNLSGATWWVDNPNTAGFGYNMYIKVTGAIS